MILNKRAIAPPSSVKQKVKQFKQDGPKHPLLTHHKVLIINKIFK